MFRNIRQRLLWSYLLVLVSLLGSFSLAVRLVFSYSLHRQFQARLMALAEGAAANTALDDRHLLQGEESILQELVQHQQSLQWFDSQGNLLRQQGRLSFPEPPKLGKFQTDEKLRLQAFTLPLVRSPEQRTVASVRAIQSLETEDSTIRKLDWGLMGGSLLALCISSGSVFLFIRQAMHPAEESMQRLKRFTADASHELRGPLMVIRSNTKVALKYPEGMRPSDREKFETIGSALDQMTHLTEDLLFLARTDQLRSSPVERIDLSQLLQEITQLYTVTANSQGLRFVIQIDANLWLTGQSTQLRRLFGNLLENALHYTPGGGEVRLEAIALSPRMLQVKVYDTGCGIAPGDRERVFDRFWRADQARSQHQGLGLGLAIAQNVVQDQGGSISVQSKLGQGSCFTVRLPSV